MKLFLDSSTLIDLLKNDASAVSKIESLKATHSFYTSTLNVYEVLRGILCFEGKRKDQMLQEFGRLVSNVSVMNIDMEAAKAGALAYSELRKSGTPINEPDPLIAGAAISNGIFSIMTKNTKHFEKIKKLEVIGY